MGLILGCFSLGVLSESGYVDIPRKLTSRVSYLMFALVEWHLSCACRADDAKVIGKSRDLGPTNKVSKNLHTSPTPLANHPASVLSICPCVREKT